jgi:hypothetical protein
MRLQLITPPVWSATGGLMAGQPTITGIAPAVPMPGASAQYLPFVGQPVSGPGVPAGAVVLTVVDAANVVLSADATLTGAQALLFGTEPVSLDEAKLHCRFEVPDTDPIYAREADFISSLIFAARRYCETKLRSALVTQTWVLYLDSFPSAGGYYNRAIREIWPMLGSMPSGLGFYPGLIPNSTGVIDIPMPPLQRIVSVAYWDFSNNLVVVDPSTYNVSLGTPARIQPQYSKVWPISRPTIDSVEVTFTCGYGPLAGNVPASVQTAIKYACSTWYENRTNVDVGGYAAVPETMDALLSIDDPGIYA